MSELARAVADPEEVCASVVSVLGRGGADARSGGCTGGLGRRACMSEVSGQVRLEGERGKYLQRAGHEWRQEA